MLLTIFLAIVFCAAMAMMLLSCVAFIQDNKFFASAPKEARDVLIQREQELFYGARAIGWTLFIISVLMILGTGVIAIWDGIRSGFTFRQFFLRFVLIFTIYKICDMALIDNFLLLKFHFFPALLPRSGRCDEGKEVWLQHQKPAAETPDHISCSICSCGVDLFFAMKSFGNSRCKDVIQVFFS